MRRWLLTLMLAGSVLACPFQCMGVFARDHSDASAAIVVEKHCECCPQRCSQPGQRPSDQPQPISDDECCGCVCNGVVLTSQWSLELIGLEPSLTAVIADADSISGSQLAGLRLAWDAAISSVEPARARRLAMHSLQF